MPKYQHTADNLADDSLPDKPEHKTLSRFLESRQWEEPGLRWNNGAKKPKQRPAGIRGSQNGIWKTGPFRPGKLKFAIRS
jgi:hypothetical protein